MDADRTRPNMEAPRRGGHHWRKRKGVATIRFLFPKALFEPVTFFLKKLLGAFLAPLPLLIFGVAVAFLLSLTERFRRVGRWGVAAGLILAWVLGTAPVADALLRPFEDRHLPILDPVAILDPDGVVVPSGAEWEGVWVVVLGGGQRTDLRYPPPARLLDESLYRVTEGVRLHRALPGSRLLFTGWGGTEALSSAEGGREAAKAMGVDLAHIEVEHSPRDTAEEAEAVALRFREDGSADRPFFLVTSAAHMPRSLAHFRARGLEPIPAPAQAYTLRRTTWDFRDLIPSGGNYRKVERAGHEALGLLWARMGGS